MFEAHFSEYLRINRCLFIILGRWGNERLGAVHREGHREFSEVTNSPNEVRALDSD